MRLVDAPPDLTPVAYPRQTAADMAGISVTQLDREIRDGRLTALKCGRRVVVRRTDLVAWLDRLETVAS